MSTQAERLARAKKLRSEGDTGAAAAKLILDKLAKDFPEDVEVLVQAAFVHDQLGQEAQAVLYYGRALARGVMKLPEREAVYIGLGSSLRVLGRYEDARAVLEKACALFPENAAVKTFLAMVLYNLQEHGEAMRILLQIIAKSEHDAQLKAYSGALDYYAERLDKIWV